MTVLGEAMLWTALHVHCSTVSSTPTCPCTPYGVQKCGNTPQPIDSDRHAATVGCYSVIVIFMRKRALQHMLGVILVCWICHIYSTIKV
jgi:hypothetical protein